MVVLICICSIFILSLLFVSYILYWTMKEDAKELGIDFKDYY